MLPFAEREGIGVIVYSPMGSGLLTGAMTRERIASLPDDDWRKQRATVPGAAALASTSRCRAVMRGRRAPRRDAGRGRGCLDAAQPRGRRRDRRVPPPRSGRRRSIGAATLELTDDDVAEHRREG